MPLPFNFDEDVLVVHYDKHTLDVKCAFEFKEEMARLIQRCHFPFVVLRLETLHFIDSAGLATLFSILRILSSHEKDLFLVGLNNQIQHIFEELGMHKVFPPLASLAEAQILLNVRKNQQTGVIAP
jgi:anti-anti-sigma factor